MGAFQKIFGVDLDGEWREERGRLCFEWMGKGKSGFQKGIEIGNEREICVVCLYV